MSGNSTFESPPPTLTTDSSESGNLPATMPKGTLSSQGSPWVQGGFWQFTPIWGDYLNRSCRLPFQLAKLLLAGEALHQEFAVSVQVLPGGGDRHRPSAGVDDGEPFVRHAHVQILHLAEFLMDR